MNLKLVREEYKEDGVFGRLLTTEGEFLAYTLEHSYENNQPKLNLGTHLCKRGLHHLHSGPIETFEITGVPGHTGILIHPGNSEKDSDGCVLLGLVRQGSLLLQSRDAFHKVTGLQNGLNEFELEVI